MIVGFAFARPEGGIFGRSVKYVPEKVIFSSTLFASSSRRFLACSNNVNAVVLSSIAIRKSGTGGMRAFCSVRSFCKDAKREPISSFIRVSVSEVADTVCRRK